MLQYDRNITRECGIWCVQRFYSILPINQVCQVIYGYLIDVSLQHLSG